MDTIQLIKKPIQQELEQQQALIAEALKSKVSTINNVVQYFLKSKGKMMRPIMVYLAAKSVGNGEITKATQQSAVALEILHSASLIHDDVIDEAGTRRGVETVNSIWDNKVAVLVGDFFLARALTESNKTESIAIQHEFTQLAASLSEGELEQMENASERRISEESYFNVIRNKTASLFVACMRIGALSVDAADYEVQLLSEFAEKLGIIFQIKDDLFDYFESGEIGKPTGNDIREGKITLPLLYPLINKMGEEYGEMLALVQSTEDINPEDVASLVAYAKKYDGIAYAEAKMNQLAAEAKIILASLPATESKIALEILVDYVISRKK